MRRSLRLRLSAALAAAILLLAPWSSAAQPGKLPQLAGIDELKSWFNANQAHARAIFLLSPT
jgi:hypothetical protein